MGCCIRLANLLEATESCMEFDFLVDVIKFARRNAEREAGLKDEKRRSSTAARTDAAPALPPVAKEEDASPNLHTPRETLTSSAPQILGNLERLSSPSSVCNDYPRNAQENLHTELLSSAQFILPTHRAAQGIRATGGAGSEGVEKAARH